MKLRLERYIEALSDDERAKVDEAIRQERRQHLAVLWQECCRLNAAGEALASHKAELYQRVFGEKYTKQNDYRIRNEFRLLVRVIERVLIAEHALEKLERQELFSDMLLLEVLSQRKLWAEFDDVLAAALAKATSEHDYVRQVQLCQEAIAATLRKGTFSHQRMLETIEWIDRAIAALADYAVTTYEQLAAQRSTTEHILDAEKIAYPPLPPLSLERTTALQQYYHLKRKAVAYTGEQRLEAARASAELISSIATKPGTALFAERISALGTLAVLLMTVACDYAASAQTSLQAIELAEQNGDPTILPLLAYNYCSALMKAGAYTEVLDFLGDKPAVFEDVRVGFRFALLRSYAYVFLCDAQAAQQSLPTVSRRYPIGEYHYGWYLYAIIAYVRGETNDALREVDNLRKHFVRQRLRTVLPTEYAIVRMFHDFFSALGYDTSQRRINARRRIEAALDRLVQSLPFYRDYLPLLWLRKQLADLT